jgi:hypothetical protein
MSDICPDSGPPHNFPCDPVCARCGQCIDPDPALTAVVEVAGAVVADWSDSDLDDNSDHPLWNRLDQLATVVRAVRGERG